MSRVPANPRQLIEAERRALVTVADALIPDGPAGVRPSRQARFDAELDIALGALDERFEDIVVLASRLAGAPPAELEAELRAASESDPDGDFQALSAVLAGAYLLIPAVREAIGYPGQANRPPRFDEGVEQVMDGILDPVIERGPIFRPVPDPTEADAG